MSERGQAFTLEAIVASLLLVGGLVFALQATAVTPLSASTSSQHIENQQQSVAEGVLTLALEDESLERSVLYWDDSNSQFWGASESYYVDKTPNNAFGDMLDRAFSSRKIIVNVNVYYQEGGKQKRQRMVYRGEPSDNAVSASATVTLSDDDVLYTAGNEPATVTGESHTYDVDAPTNTLSEVPVVSSSIDSITDSSGDIYDRTVDYAITDADGDGKADTIDWSVGGVSPDDEETFTVDYTPVLDERRFYAPDAHASGVYNVLEVEVVAWRQ